MKQSIGLVILQLINIVVGVIITFYVAGVLSANIYAVFGVYSVIVSISSVFSNIGMETYAGRNVLYWKACGTEERIKMFVSQALFSRVLMAVLISFLMLTYAFYMSKYKFHGEYYWLFVGMCFCSVFKALNDSLGLLLKAFNKYLLSAFSTCGITVLGRIAALLAFQYSGFYAYFIVTLVTPLVISIPLLIVLRKWYHVKYMKSMRSLKRNIFKTKTYTIYSYLRFGSNTLDTFLVSIFLSPEILATYSLVKRMEEIVNSFVANFFDPMLQKLVALKNDLLQWRMAFERIFKIQYIVSIIAIVMTIPVYLYSGKLIEWVNMSHYPYIQSFLLCMYIGASIKIIYKIHYDSIMFFYAPSNMLLSQIVTAICLTSSFLFMQLFSINLLYLYVVLANLMIGLYAFIKAPNIASIEKNILKNINI